MTEPIKKIKFIKIILHTFVIWLISVVVVIGIEWVITKLTSK